MILTATEVTEYSNISCTAGTITSKKLIDTVQARLTMMLNNYFLTDLEVTDTMTFNATARTIVSDSTEFDDYNFLAGDDIYVYGSYRNDGYYTIGSVTTTTLTLASGASVVDELSSATIMVSVVRWPQDVKQAAALMCAYDYDTRTDVSANVKSRSLGPWSESYTDGEKDEYGYPKKLTAPIDYYRIARAY